jgi:hypothetical protein
LRTSFEVERRLLRPDPYGLLAGLIEQDGERRRAYRRKFEREDLEQRAEHCPR